MLKRIIVSLVLLMVFGLASVFAMGGKPPQKEKASVSVESTVTSTEEWKTYVSKAGFSVSYPKEWYLYEETGEGWRIGPEGPPFGISNISPDDPNSTKNVPEEERLGIGFNVWPAPENLPEENKEKLVYIAKKQQMNSVDKLEFFEKDDILICLAYGVPRGRFEKYYRLFFYLPQSNNVVFSDSNFESKKKLKKIIEKIHFQLVE